jgi:hypothetical protein
MQHKLVDDDGQALNRVELPFSVLPLRPSDWASTSLVSFNLGRGEGEFFRRQLVDLSPASRPGHTSVLAKLAVGRKVHATTCHSPEIAEIARGDAIKLRRAGYAAALAAVCRAIYAALVEMLREEEDHQPTSHIHREHLPKVLHNYATYAGQLSLPELIEDVGGMPSVVTDVLDCTLEWLKEGARDIMAMRGVYERAECCRKGNRARLSRITGSAQRLDWNNEEHAKAEPLHYRWGVVQDLLDDLWDAP